MEGEYSTTSNQDLEAELVLLADELNSMNHELHVLCIELRRRRRDVAFGQREGVGLKVAVRKVLHEPQDAAVSLLR